VIDADASPSGYIAWYNHYAETSKIRTIRPATKNERFGVQRMEMLAIYFALRDNMMFIRSLQRRRVKRQVVVAVRSDSKSTVEQLRGFAEIRDAIMRRIVSVIGKLLAKMGLAVVFDHLQRSENIAGLMLERRRRKERERMISAFSLQYSALEDRGILQYPSLPFCV
jgi:hypothetical protein